MRERFRNGSNKAMQKAKVRKTSNNLSSISIDKESK
jgi:hypothetical protein